MTRQEQVKQYADILKAYFIENFPYVEYNISDKELHEFILASPITADLPRTAYLLADYLASQGAEIQY